MVMKPFTPDEERVVYAGLPRKLCGAGVIITRGQGGDMSEILIVKPSCKDGWSLPGGAVNAIESPRDGAMREMIEEIGDCATVGSLVSIEYEPCHDMHSDMVHFLFMGVIKPGVEPKPDGSEIIDAQWIQISDIEAYLPRGLASCVRGGLNAGMKNKIDYQGEVQK